MILVRAFVAAAMFAMILDEIVVQEIKGSDKIGTVRMGLMMIFEMWLLGG